MNSASLSQKRIFMVSCCDWSIEKKCFISEDISYSYIILKITPKCDFYGIHTAEQTSEHKNNTPNYVETGMFTAAKLTYETYDIN